MKTLTIDNLRASNEGGVAELSAVLRWGAQKWDVFFRTAHSQVASSGDPFIPAALLPAMRVKLDVDVRVAVSEDTVIAARKVQEIEAAWHPTWSIVKLEAMAHVSDVPRGPPGAVAAFFTGGVDSFYTLLKHRNEITHLVFVSGFDVPLRRHAMRQLVVTQLRKTAARLQLPLIEVETNLRDFSDSLAFSWEDQHGAALAAVAHFLAPSFAKIYIPSTYALPFLYPYGSHPGLDPLWSTKGLALLHDGVEATRFDKIGALRSWDAALDALRVCWQAVEGEYNCCRCRKCLWTMALLRAHGLLQRAASFPRPLDLKRLGEQGADVTEQRYRLIQAIAKLELRGEDPELAAALWKALNHKESFGRSLRRSARRLLHSVHQRLKLYLRPYRALLRSSFRARQGA